MKPAIIILSALAFSVVIADYLLWKIITGNAMMNCTTYSSKMAV